MYSDGTEVQYGKLISVPVTEDQIPSESLPTQELHIGDEFDEDEDKVSP